MTSTSAFSPEHSPSSTPCERIAIKARSLSKTYHQGAMKVTALSPTYLDIPSGKFIAIMGPSGSGKSTLLHVLSTLDAPDEVPGSSLQIGGVELLDKKDNELSHFRAEKIGFIFQSFNLLPVLTAEQNIELQAGLAGQRVDKLWNCLLYTSPSPRDRG